LLADEIPEQDSRAITISPDKLFLSLPLPLIGRQLDQELSPQCASWKKGWRYRASEITVNFLQHVFLFGEMKDAK
jgi:hypothetical protein